MQVNVRVSKAENELSPMGQNCRSQILNRNVHVLVESRK